MDLRPTKRSKENISCRSWNQRIGSSRGPMVQQRVWGSKDPLSNFVCKSSGSLGHSARLFQELRHNRASANWLAICQSIDIPSFTPKFHPDNLPNLQKNRTDCMIGQRIAPSRSGIHETDGR